MTPSLWLTFLTPPGPGPEEELLENEENIPLRFLSSQCRYGGRLARLIMIQTSERHLLCRWCVSDNLESASQHLRGIWGMQDALMQATFLKPTQRTAVTFLNFSHESNESQCIAMWGHRGAREERIMLYLRLAIVQNWHILPKRKQEIKKYYAVLGLSVVCHEKCVQTLWKKVSQENWENSLYFLNNCKWKF